MNSCFVNKTISFIAGQYYLAAAVQGQPVSLLQGPHKDLDKRQKKQKISDEEFYGFFGGIGLRHDGLALSVLFFNWQYVTCSQCVEEGLTYGSQNKL